MFEVYDLVSVGYISLILIIHLEIIVVNIFMLAYYFIIAVRLFAKHLLHSLLHDGR